MVHLTRPLHRCCWERNDRGGAARILPPAEVDSCVLQAFDSRAFALGGSGSTRFVPRPTAGFAPPDEVSHRFGRARKRAAHLARRLAGAAEGSAQVMLQGGEMVQR